MVVTLSIGGVPPDRTHPGRCADLDSPNAGPLAKVAREFMARAPDAFPLRDPFGITVVFGNTKPTFEGYGAIDPIIEVLVDVGMIADERLEDRERELQDPDAGETYTVTLEPARLEGNA